MNNLTADEIKIILTVLPEAYLPVKEAINIVQPIMSKLKSELHLLENDEKK